MYVCICHNLNDRKVQDAIDTGAKTPAAVFKHHQCTVQCGKCVPTMREKLATHAPDTRLQTAHGAVLDAEKLAAPEQRHGRAFG